MRKLCNDLSTTILSTFIVVCAYLMSSIILASVSFDIASKIAGYSVFISQNWLYWAIIICVIWTPAFFIGEEIGILFLNYKFKKDTGVCIDAEIRSRIKKRPENWRLGQAAFNFAYDINPDIANELRGTDWDPFFTNDPEEVDNFIKEFIKRSISNVNIDEC